MPGFDLAPALDDKTITLRFRGRLDADSAGPAVERVRETCRRADGRPVVADLAELTFMDSTGLQVILVLWRELRECGGQLQVVNANGQPLGVLKMLGLARILGLDTSR